MWHRSLFLSFWITFKKVTALLKFPHSKMHKHFLHKKDMGYCLGSYPQLQKDMPQSFMHPFFQNFQVVSIIYLYETVCLNKCSPDLAKSICVQKQISAMHQALLPDINLFGQYRSRASFISLKEH